ncbi:MAG TPA: ATP-binding cassette domain-containing protein [Vicinamibacterales bacterium]|nr:ATP-binding cassette domain-containing protein [Vicinamibacterales bacterium]
MPAPPALRIAGLTRRYQAVQPLRIRDLTVAPGERVALSGLDAGAAEALVNLVTGASLPDEGEVVVLGQATSAITAGDDWLASLDRFGIVTPRAVLLEGSTLLQNVALPLSLEIEPMPASLSAEASSLAREAGIDERWFGEPVGRTPEAVRARVHLARAVALSPALLLLEHPTAAVPEADRAAFAEDAARVLERRGLTTVIVSEDVAFTLRVAHRRLALQRGTGVLVPQRERKGWFR